MQEKQMNGDISKIQADIAPYLHKQFLRKPYVESADVTTICRLIRGKYKNTTIAPRPGNDGKPYLKIKVHQLLFGGKLSYEIRTKGKSIHTHDPLSWIDWIEEWDALIN